MSLARVSSGFRSAASHIERRIDNGFAISSASQLARSTLASASTRSVSSIATSVIVPATQTKKVFTPKGPGGRHSSTGHVATVFGATGFLGRYLVSKLAKAGTQVVVPYRDQDEARHLKEWDLKNDTQIEECLRHSDTVYNLVGRDYKTKNFSFDDVHVSGARRLARIAHTSGVSRFIHLSHLNAAPDSASQFYRTKFHGEQAVKDAFPEATIVRPGWMYGHEDRLLNTIAVSPSVFRVNHGETRIAPVHVMDVAQALSVMLTAPSTASSTFAFAGPQTYTFEQLLHLVEALTLQKLSGPNFPKPILALAAHLWDLVWWPTLSPDEVKRRFIDDVKIEEGLKGFKDLGIEPDVLEDVAIVYLRRYRSSSYFDLPVASGGIKLRSQKYHVVE